MSVSFNLAHLCKAISILPVVYSLCTRRIYCSVQHVCSAPLVASRVALRCSDAVRARTTRGAEYGLGARTHESTSRAHCKPSCMSSPAALSSVVELDRTESWLNTVMYRNNTPPFDTGDNACNTDDTLADLGRRFNSCRSLHARTALTHSQYAHTTARYLYNCDDSRGEWGARVVSTHHSSGRALCCTVQFSMGTQVYNNSFYSTFCSVWLPAFVTPISWDLA